MEAVKQKILIIEDDEDIAGIEKDFLESSGFYVEIQTDGIKGTERALSGEFALILLDIMLPGKDGLTICREIRKEIDIPILMVSARIENMDKIRGLDLGADDYITKPFSPTEVVARVKSHIARFQRLTKIGKTAAPAQPEEIDFDWLKINHRTRCVLFNNNEISLTNKEYELLYLFASNASAVFSKEYLYEKVWGEDMHGVLKTVAVHINRLRDKIEPDPSQPIRLQTVWGAGYRFMPCPLLFVRRAYIGRKPESPVIFIEPDMG